MVSDPAPLMANLLVHELGLRNGYLAPAFGQNIIWIFSNLKVSTF